MMRRRAHISSWGLRSLRPSIQSSATRLLGRDVVLLLGSSIQGLKRNSASQLNCPSFGFAFVKSVIPHCIAFLLFFSHLFRTYISLPIFVFWIIKISVFSSFVVPWAGGFTRLSGFVRQGILFLLPICVMLCLFCFYAFFRVFFCDPIQQFNTFFESVRNTLHEIMQIFSL